MSSRVNMPAVRFNNFSVPYKQYKLGEITSSVSRPIEMKDEEDYDLVTVKRRNEGIVERGVFKGKEVKVKSQYKIEAGDFLISKRQIIHGACEIVPSNLEGAIVSNEYHILHGKEDLLLTEYLNLLSKLPKTKNYFALACVGVDIEKMLFRIEDWKKRTVMIPSIEEQQKIASYFKLLNKKIEKQSEKIQKLAELKKGLMQKIFSQEIRFKDEEGKDYPAWRLKFIGEEITVSSCVRVHQKDWTISGVPFYRARDIVAIKNGLNPSTLFISKELYNEKISKSGHINKDDVMITGVGTIGIPYLIKNDQEIYFKDGNVLWLKNNNKLIGEYLYYYILSEKVQKFISTSSGLGTVGTYTIENAKKTPLEIPCIEEQQKIGGFISNIDRVISLEANKLELLKKQKDGLMQQIFI